MSISREDVRMRYDSEGKYRLFIHENKDFPESDPIADAVVNNPSALDKAKDVYFAQVYGAVAKEPEIDGKKASKLTRDNLNQFNKQQLITICVKGDIEWTPQDTTEALVQKIIDKYNLEPPVPPKAAE